MAGEGVHQRHVHVVPNFDGLVPGSSDANAGLLLMEKFDARYGIGVLVLVNDVFLLASSIPDSNCAVKTACDNLSVIWGESN